MVNTADDPILKKNAFSVPGIYLTEITGNHIYLLLLLFLVLFCRYILKVVMFIFCHFYFCLSLICIDFVLGKVWRQRK